MKIDTLVVMRQKPKMTPYSRGKQKLRIAQMGQFYFAPSTMEVNGLL